ncbi:hypothetical protein [Aeromonas veronii]|uniref:hypothetical protein n=1 Tax=Aeromonas veronii TaxID=654 RepID=UPI0035B84C26
MCSIINTETDCLPERFRRRGSEIRRELLTEYDIVPIAHFKLLPGQEKYSYSGYVLKDRYYCFQFTHKESGAVGSFLCGYKAAEDFLSLLEIGSVSIFNPFRTENFGTGTGTGTGTAVKTIKINESKQLFVDAARLLMMLWDSASRGMTPLALALQGAIDAGMDKPAEYKHVLTVNTILAKSGRTLTQHLEYARQRYATIKFKNYNFEPLNKIVERAKYKNHPPFF